MSQNLLYPGRPNYEGPVQGLFGLLHHSVIAEWSDNVMERVEYVKKAKPKHEVDIRLWNMCYLSEERVPKKLVEAGKTWDEAWKTWDEALKTWEEAVKIWEAEKTYWEAWETYREAWETYYEALQTFSPHLLNLIKELVPDTAWNGKELVFPLSINLTKVINYEHY